MIYMVCGVLRRPPWEVLIAERWKEDLKGRWELPGGEIVPGEMPEQAITRKWGEELGITPHVGPVLFTLPDSRLPEYTLHFIECFPTGPKIATSGNVPEVGHVGQRLVWIRRVHLAQYDLLPQDRAVLEQIL